MGVAKGGLRKSERTDLRLKIKLSPAAAIIRSSPLPNRGDNSIATPIALRGTDVEAVLAVL